MRENHQKEQYFFDPPTVTHLADFVATYADPCCLCTPLVGQAVEESGGSCTTLDIDGRFAHLEGFREYNLYRPAWLGAEFGLILCDPPFFKVSLSQLFTAVRQLSCFDYSQPLLIAYLKRRELNLLSTFHLFNLEPTGYQPGYVTVQRTERNVIELYGNLGVAAHALLRGETL